jgi:hypothetical protein
MSEVEPFKFIYEFPFMFPPEECGVGRWGINARLDSEFAFKARDTEMSEVAYEMIQERGRTIIERFGLSGYTSTSHPYRFVEGSWLLHYAETPGNACGLGLDHPTNSSVFGMWEKLKEEGEFPRAIGYDSHNVDSMIQSHSLISLFVNWADVAKAVLSSK